jgi:formylmethanofuran dehydrogenase subunit E
MRQEGTYLCGFFIYRGEKEELENYIQERWEKAAAFHGHMCPGLAIGVRACEAACQALNCSFSTDEQLVCVTENDACGVDAVSVLLGCSLGKGNLLYHGTGKMAFNFFSRKSKRGVRVYFKINLSQSSRNKMMDYILSAELKDLFTISEPSIPMPIPAKHFASIACKKCGEYAPEHKIRLQDGELVCLDCYEEYTRGF